MDLSILTQYYVLIADKYNFNSYYVIDPIAIRAIKIQQKRHRLYVPTSMGKLYLESEVGTQEFLEEVSSTFRKLYEGTVNYSKYIVEEIAKRIIEFYPSISIESLRLYTSNTSKITISNENYYFSLEFIDDVIEFSISNSLQIRVQLPIADINKGSFGHNYGTLKMLPTQTQIKDILDEMSLGVEADYREMNEVYLNRILKGSEIRDM